MLNVEALTHGTVYIGSYIYCQICFAITPVWNKLLYNDLIFPERIFYHLMCEFYPR